MTITKTLQGYQCSKMVKTGKYAYLHQKLYIGYTKREALAEFKRECKTLSLPY